jgi:ABC-type nickel/cobalt efflux system permease component RcnA
VTATHTIGVFALGLVTLALSAFIVPEQLYPWLNLVSGVLVVAIGATVFRSRFRHRGHTHDHHSHAPGPDPETGPSRRSLVAVGITGGLLPCPSALVVLLAAISLHRVAFGMLLIVAFSAGLALSITGVGLVAVYAKQIFKRASFEGRLVRLVPAASALVILVAGLAMTARALPKVS